MTDLQTLTAELDQLQPVLQKVNAAREASEKAQQRTAQASPRVPEAEKKLKVALDELERYRGSGLRSFWHERVKRDSQEHSARLDAAILQSRVDVATAQADLAAAIKGSNDAYQTLKALDPESQQRAWDRAWAAKEHLLATSSSPEGQRLRQLDEAITGGRVTIQRLEGMARLLDRAGSQQNQLVAALDRADSANTIDMFTNDDGPGSNGAEFMRQSALTSARGYGVQLRTTVAEITAAGQEMKADVEVNTTWAILDMFGVLDGFFGEFAIGSQISTAKTQAQAAGSQLSRLAGEVNRQLNETRASLRTSEASRTDLVRTAV